MQFRLPTRSASKAATQHRRKVLPDRHTYYFVIYISVVHLKFDIKFEIILQYPSDDIYGHIISSID